MISDILLNLMLNESFEKERNFKIMCIKKCADMLLTQKSTSPIRRALSSGGKINEYKSILFSRKSCLLKFIQVQFFKEISAFKHF